MSDNAQPTPGPWMPFDVGRACPVYEVRDNAGSVVADLRPSAFYGDTDHANARLIAAAPDGLALAEMVIEAVDVACVGERDHPQRALADVLRAAWALRAKATGA